MWGQEKGLQSRWCQQRIIPTRVGTSCIYIAKTHYRQDHPHACGDKIMTAYLIYAIWGSSPRVWGQAFFISFIPPVLRIIPTRVGTSNLCRAHELIYQDHPHACGDKSRSRHGLLFSLGSSPRVWGQVVCFLDLCAQNGIIPTRVGTSHSDLKDDGTEQDHPHACGDKAYRKGKTLVGLGSSPRVWGQVTDIKT